jgi:hypothetical protein
MTTCPPRDIHNVPHAIKHVTHVIYASVLHGIYTLFPKWGSHKYTPKGYKNPPRDNDVPHGTPPRVLGVWGWHIPWGTFYIPCGTYAVGDMSWVYTVGNISRGDDHVFPKGYTDIPHVIYPQYIRYIPWTTIISLGEHILEKKCHNK